MEIIIKPTERGRGREGESDDGRDCGGERKRVVREKRERERESTFICQSLTSCFHQEHSATH